MILNMPVTNGAITSTTAPPQNQSELCDFLKRKYNDNDISPPAGGTPETSANYAEDTVMWKKRHIEVSSYDMPSANSPFKQQQQQTPPPEGFSHNRNVAITTPVSNSSDLATGTGTFNIIANSSAFINDLFAYDANLLGSVTSTVGLTDGVLCASEPIFTSPSTICVNTTNQFEEDNADNWQASDLLELDHRYNSSLQTEITQLNPTVSLKPHEEESMASLATNSNSSPTQTQHVHFVAPQNPQTPCEREQQNTSSQIVDAEADFEDKNLSWLLNFKFDEFPHLNPDISGGCSGSGGKSVKNQHSNGYGAAASSAVGYKTMSGSPSSNSSGSHHGDRSKSPKNSNKTGKKFEELVMEVTSEMDGTEMTVAENVVIEDTSPQRAPKKPPFTYTELIEYALEDKGELTVSGIYQWISDRFPYYKSNDDRWKNSVRHNLSINPHFRKGHKAPQGAGHLWTISSGDSAENVLAWEHKKQRLDLFFKMESMNRERLAQHQQHLQQQAAAAAVAAAADRQNQRKHLGCQQDQQCLYDEAAVAAAAIQQEMLQQQPSNSASTSIQSQSSRPTKDILVQHPHTAHHSTVNGILPRSSEHSPHLHLQSTLHELPYNDLLSDDELRKTAGQILNGIHREVEVQSVNQSIISTYQDVLLENEDYLNPVHKDVAVSESGLRHAHTTIANTSAQCSSTTPYYVTEIDPMELGIHMTSHPHSLSHPQHHNSNSQHQQQLQQQQQHHHHHHHHHHNGHVTDPTTTSLNGEETDVVLFNDEFNLNYFTYNPATDIVA